MPEPRRDAARGRSATRGRARAVWQDVRRAAQMPGVYCVDVRPNGTVRLVLDHDPGTRSENKEERKLNSAQRRSRARKDELHRRKRENADAGSDNGSTSCRGSSVSWCPSIRALLCASVSCAAGVPSGQCR